MNLWPCLQQRMKMFFYFGKTQGEPSMIELGGVEEAVKKTAKIIKSEDTVLIHFQFV